jgi:cytoplasmic iron level regulating protein YaaA (DUF328/UPF0246 family)
MRNILILAICSNHKIKMDKNIDYTASQSIEKFLTEESAEEMYEARRQIRDLITSNRVARDGKPLNEMPYNQDIVDGMDFRGPVKRGNYLPALQRYDGGFYKGFGVDKARCQYLDEGKFKHEMLIVSGLYGLLTIAEPIQCYSCNVTDHQDIEERWKKDSLLTRLIVEYIKERGIVKVFDFMGVERYRDMIDWDMIRGATKDIVETKDKVLHCYSKQFAGTDILPSLGLLAKKFLVEKHKPELWKIGNKQTEELENDEIVFLSSREPGKDLAREIPERAKRASEMDKIGRMRRNISMFLKVALGDELYKSKHEFSGRVAALKSRKFAEDRDVVRDMEAFGRLRNDNEYDERLSPEDLQEIREHYSAIEKWAIKRKHYAKVADLEEIEF